MLKKLVKYDLEYVFKILGVFYSLAIFFALLTRLFLNMENSFLFNIIGQICSGTTCAMLFNVLINNLMRLWVRFKTNFYGDESYLTHTLPLEKKTLYLSKFLTSFITLFVSIGVMTLTLLIAYYSKENLEILKRSILTYASLYESSILKLIVSFLIVFFLQIACMLQSGYTGIILGHRKNSGKVGYSILIGFGVYIVSQILAVGVLFFVSLFNKDLMNLFITNELVNIHLLKDVFWISIGFYTLYLLVSYFLNLKLFQKGVNVD